MIINTRPRFATRLDGLTHADERISCIPAKLFGYPQMLTRTPTYTALSLVEFEVFVKECFDKLRQHSA
jgi:hypothetical protein